MIAVILTMCVCFTLSMLSIAHIIDNYNKGPNMAINRKRGNKAEITLTSDSLLQYNVTCVYISGKKFVPIYFKHKNRHNTNS